MKTLDEALEQFELVKGSAGSESEKKACETSLLGWIYYEKWTGDSLECAHPLIRSLMIQHNDSDTTTKEQRIEAVRLGMTGALDTWWIPAEVILSYFGDFKRDETPTQNDRLVKMLTGVAAWKLDKVRRDLTGANLADAYLAGAYLKGAYLTGANLADAYLARAYLKGADLAGADLAGADLAGANLTDADLAGADLTGANLAGANLARAYGEPRTLPVGWEYKSGLIVRKS